MTTRRFGYLMLLEVCKHCRSTMSSVLLTVIFASVMFVVYQTLRIHHPPLEVKGDGNASTAMAGDLIMVEYERDIKINQEFTGHVSRTVICENGWSHDIPATIRKFEVGEYHANRSFTFPYAVPDSTRCKMLTLVTWTPFASLREHSFNVPPIPFVLIPHDHPRRHIDIPHTHGDSHPKKPLTKPDEIYVGETHFHKEK